MINKIRTMLAAALLAAAPLAIADSSKSDIGEVLVILSSDSLQTQGMAMVLSNTMAGQGARVNVLLCDQAGDLALKSYEAASLKPNDVTPGQMLRGLMKAGGIVNVCALYLPNSAHTEDDLIDGVGVARPPEMTRQMMNPEMRTFTF